VSDVGLVDSLHRQPDGDGHPPTLP
jgi:hypothetical protein